MSEDKIKDNTQSGTRAFLEELHEKAAAHTALVDALERLAGFTFMSSAQPIRGGAVGKVALTYARGPRTGEKIYFGDIKTALEHMTTHPVPIVAENWVLDGFWVSEDDRTDFYECLVKISKLRLEKPEDAADEISRILWGETGRAQYADFSGTDRPSLIYVEDMPNLVFELQHTDEGWQPSRVQSS